MSYSDSSISLTPSHAYFIGIDSDGCVFDTMEIKHKECFCPEFIKHFGLQQVSRFARETWEFVNLYSRSRGCNRFHALLKVNALMAHRREVLARKAVLPDLSPLASWVEKESRLGNPALEGVVRRDGDPLLSRVLNWSVAVNRSIAEMVKEVAPFPGVVEVLEKAAPLADLMVVSQTPLEALRREWKENGIDHYPVLIAGQENGTKGEHLQYAAVGKYAPDRILMIGDAPGDLKAALSNKALFFPVMPGQEEASWENFLTEGLDRFFRGSFRGEYQETLIRDFLNRLPETPSWDGLMNEYENSL